LKGIFITFEGVEGSGKSTQIRLLDEFLRSKDRQTVLTRESGGTSIGDRIREILLSPKSSKMHSTTELLLYEAARCQHIHEVIGPALESDKIILCDRYADATTAYQGAAREIDMNTVETLHGIATENLNPDLTILLDCPVEVGLKHAVRRNEELNLTGSEDRFEREKLDFHERVRQGYLDIAKREPNRVKVIDATGSIEEVHKRVLAVIEQILEL
jgi:dTMP kinase